MLFRSRPERSTALSGVVWTVGAVLLAGTDRVWLAGVGVVLCGTGWMGVINTLYSNYMVELPGWMKGRGASMVMLNVWLGTSAGAVVWGAVASSTDVRTALWWAAACNVAIVTVSPAVLRVHAPALVAHGDGAVAT